MEEKKKKRNLILGIIGIIVLVAGVVGLTYAYFSSKSQSDTVTVTSGNLKINFTDGALINVSDIEPINESEILTKATKKSFGIAKTSDSNNMYARIDITDLVVSENFQNYDLKWALYQDSTKITTGTFVVTSDGSNSINMTTNVLIDSTTAKNYNLYIWIQETNKDQSAMMNGSLSGKITVTGQKDKLNTLASNILLETINENPTFSATSTDKGLFVQKDDSTKSNYGFPTYYYRGAVENNYVTFAGQIWKIIRINEDGSIRILNSSAISEGNYSNSGYSTENLFDDPCYEESGKHYESIACNTNYSGSYIENFVNSWYQQNIYNNETLDNKVQVGSFCNDNSGNIKLFDDVEHPFTCVGNVELINSKIGLITAAEGVNSVSAHGSSNASYLSGDVSFWTMTAGMYDSNLFIVYWCENLNYFDAMSPDYAEISPVINLKADVEVTGGDGTSTTPYIIK